ncbi:MAG: hypothetical protein ABH919_02930 [bacterium]
MKLAIVLLVAIILTAAITMEIIKYTNDVEEKLKKAQGETEAINGKIEKTNARISEINKEIEDINEDADNTSIKIKTIVEKIQEVNKEIGDANKKIEATNDRMKESVDILKREIKKPESKIQQLLDLKTNISSGELKKLSRNITSNTVMKDGYYFAAPIEIVERILKDDSVDKLKYINDTRDCDDYALMTTAEFSRWYFPHPGIAIASGNCFEENSTATRHAWNAVIIENNGTIEIRYIEPQTDKIFAPAEFNCTADSLIWY